jgi:hypothetical protein
MKMAMRLRHGKRPGQGDAHHVLRQHDKRVAGADRLVALRGVVGIAGAREDVMAPGLEGKAFAIGQCDVKSLK